jgi:hypothetical protein
MSTQNRPCVSLAALPLLNCRRGLRALALSLAALATGCGPGDDVPTGADSPTKVLAQPLSSTPATCQEFKEANPEAVDGYVTLYISGNVSLLPYGVAMSCNGGLAPANIDLRGTPFAVAPGAFAVGGAGYKGSTAYSEANQVVSLSGGGNCGWDAPVGSFNPFNQSGAQLQLQFRAASRPATCQEIKSANPQAEDGNYTLYINNDPFRPWNAWCQNMAGVPSEYLTLVQVDASSNYSQYTAGGNSPGTDVRTTFTRLRLDPLTLRVNTADQTFSTSTGSLLHGGQPVTSMPYGVAMGCSRWGVGNVDLRGTPFAVATGQFRIGGVSASGSYNYSAGNQVVSLSGYGGCGWAAPLDSFNPFNQNGKPLTLVYTGTP